MATTNVRQTPALPLVVLAAFLGCVGAAFGGQSRPSVSVATLHVNGSGWASAPPALSEVASELLTAELVGSGRFRVIDRDVPVQQTTGACETDFIITGSVVRFSTEKKRRGFGGFIPVPFLGGVNSSRTEAVVEITLRLVSPVSGEIVAASSGRGAASRKAVAVGGLTLAGATGGAGFSNSSEEFRDSLLGDALRRAVQEATRQLLVAAERP
jgi:curli biogenesis system outer membrane secretion channel CsgG